MVVTPTRTSKEREVRTMQTYKVDELLARFQRAPGTDLNVRITKGSPGAVKDPKKDDYLYVKDAKAAKPETIVRNDKGLTADNLAALKEAGITDVTVYEPGAWELVCEELCGQGHATMRGEVVVLDNAEYQAKF